MSAFVIFVKPAGLLILFFDTGLPLQIPDIMVEFVLENMKGRDFPEFILGLGRLIKPGRRNPLSNNKQNGHWKITPFKAMKIKYWRKPSPCKNKPD